MCDLYNNPEPEFLFLPSWRIGWGPKEYGQYLLNKRGYSHKRTNEK